MPSAPNALALAGKLTVTRLRVWKLVTGLSAGVVALGLAGVVYAAATAVPGKTAEEPLLWVGAGLALAAVCCSLFGLVELWKGRNPGPG